MTGRRRTGIAIGAVLLLVAAAVVGGLLAVAAHDDGKGSGTTGTGPSTTTNPFAAEEARAVVGAERAVNVVLPAAEGAPAPLLGKTPFRRALGSHEVVGFMPWYELGSVRSTNLAELTTVVYSALDVRSDGALEETSSSGGWTSLESGGASTLVTAGHAARDRVLLSVFAQSAAVIGPLCAKATLTGKRLADELAPLLSEYSFNGIDLDFESQDALARTGFVSFVKALTSRLRALDPSADVMLNVFPQSVYETGGFIDAPALAPLVDQLFVMAYDMEDTQVASADAPLTGADVSDASVLAAYSAAGLARKTILGVPFYGYDFPVEGPGLGAQAAENPYAVTYDAIASSIVHEHHKPLWDPTTDTPYTVFKLDRKWHETWFDDPVSIALKTALASQFHVAGVGAWELGMVRGQPQMVSLLTGGSPVVKLPIATTS